MDEDDISLDSDQLGEKGELLFQTLCVDAQLICNKATRDRSGWDFIVEFPIDHTNPGQLDERSNPISCRFQQKAMWAHNDRIKLRLSSIERLAKDTGPSFIYVLKIAKDTRLPTSAWLIEMRGDALAKVLAKLREEQSAQRFHVNQATMYLYPSKIGREVDRDPASFKKAVADAVGSDIAAYAAAKRTELQTLGYEPGAKNVSMTLKLEPGDELADVMLGLIPAKATNLRARHTRFGITLDAEEFPAEAEAEIRISPLPFDTCEVSVRRNRLAEPAIFSGQIYAPPARSIKDFAVRIVTESLEINFRGQEFKFRATSVFPETTLKTAAEWRNYFLMADALSTTGATIEVRPSDGKMGVISHRIENSLSSETVEWARGGLAISDMLLALMRRAGAASGPSFTMNEMVEQQDLISFVFEILNGNDLPEPLKIGAEKSVVDHYGAITDAVHINYVALGSSMLVMIIDLTLEYDHSASKYVSTKVELRQLIVLATASYLDFVRKEAGDGGKMILSRMFETSTSLDDGRDE
ncbi:hypothetical protein HW571_23410 [Agrobacterium genomosp. 3]|uniref:hypothetical protein n=1 Tax=Agrobacterium tomkonis TaxID=1183410 RepID=UPI001CD83B7E|nr:hypothetical protein [Agrobacterium tomkonis]MCA1878950.1 hypothetical protein [Agrobacterium tumefaciens]MCA1894128.1 hypothetical protein [Agrobacterium tomkonis]